MPRKVREVTRILSQAELIQQALDTEEGNIKEHRDYLIQEEEKRRRARVVRMAVTGPLVRWVSKVEFERPRVEEVGAQMVKVYTLLDTSARRSSYMNAI